MQSPTGRPDDGVPSPSSWGAREGSDAWGGRRAGGEGLGRHRASPCQPPSQEGLFLRSGGLGMAGLRACCLGLLHGGYRQGRSRRLCILRHRCGDRCSAPLVPGICGQGRSCWLCLFVLERGKRRALWVAVSLCCSPSLRDLFLFPLFQQLVQKSVPGHGAIRCRALPFSPCCRVLVIQDAPSSAHSFGTIVCRLGHGRRQGRSQRLCIWRR